MFHRSLVTVTALALVCAVEAKAQQTAPTRAPSTPAVICHNQVFDSANVSSSLGVTITPTTCVGTPSTTRVRSPAPRPRSALRSGPTTNMGVVAPPLRRDTLYISLEPMRTELLGLRRHVDSSLASFGTDIRESRSQTPITPISTSVVEVQRRSWGRRNVWWLAPSAVIAIGGIYCAIEKCFKVENRQSVIVNGSIIGLVF